MKPLPSSQPVASLRIPNPAAAPEPIIRIRGLTFRYTGEVLVLRGIDLDIYPGEKVALVGPNGSGKTTLLLHLNGILRGEGTIEVGGLPVEQPHLPQIRALVGLLFQEPDDQLFSPTVYEDVAFGPLQQGLSAEEVHQRVSQALNQVGLSDLARRPPYRLSVGEKKRAALATVLARHPQILALDEPTANLDPRSRRRLVALLQSLPQTMLVATHDMRLVAEGFARLVVLDEGQVVADGPTAELLRDRALLEAHGLEPPCMPAGEA